MEGNISHLWFRSLASLSFCLFRTKRDDFEAERVIRSNFSLQCRCIYKEDRWGE